MNKLETKIRWVWTAQTVIIALILGLVTGIAGAIINRIWIGPAVFLIFSVLGVVYSFARYDAWSYELREDHLYLERGVFRKVKSMVPFVRIQHVDTQRGVIDRAADLSRVVVYTAGSRGADVTIPGLLPDHAERLQEKLRDVAIESEDRDAV